MSRYLSLPDLCEQVKSQCPPDTPIPSIDLVRLQFCPKNSAVVSCSSELHSIQYKIQVRQLRQQHADEHYAAAIFKYLQELAIHLQDFCSLIFCDDKAKVDIGEPNLAISTGVHGKKTLAPSISQVSALDHDVHSKSSLTPSVTMICDILKDICSSFYRGKVHVRIKDAVFEALSPFRHATELLANLLLLKGDVPPVVVYRWRPGP